MKIDILTLFPEMFSPLEASIIKRAKEKKKVEINIHNIRNFAVGKHKVVDDTPYGGGPGMVLKIEPIYTAIKNLNLFGKIIFVSPQGKLFNQQKAKEFSIREHICFLCGHYEGIDERVSQLLINEEISIGDYILTGGELAVMVIIDAIVRLIPGVLGNEESSKNESFTNFLLDYPHYTKPLEFMGLKVPEILLSGNHQLIEKWRKEKSIEQTLKKRKDLLTKANFTENDKKFIKKLTIGG